MVIENNNLESGLNIEKAGTDNLNGDKKDDIALKIDKQFEDELINKKD